MSLPKQPPVLLDAQRPRGRASMSNDPLASVPLMASAGGDPFHVVKDELVVKLRSIEGRVATFTTLLYGSGTTHGNPRFREAKKAVAREVRAAEAQLRDLALTVEYVERDRAAFSHIDDAELNQRKAFVDKSKRDVASARDAVAGPRARAKIEADEQAALASQRGAYDASGDLEMQNTAFIHSSHARVAATIQEQDEGLEQLDGAVDRIHGMAEEIHGELSAQARMLDDTEDELDETTEKMNFVMGKLSKLLKTKDTCQLWTIVALTVVLIVMVFLVIYS